MKVYKLYLVQYYYLGKRYYKCGLTTKKDVMDRFKYDILKYKLKNFRVIKSGYLKGLMEDDTYENKLFNLIMDQFPENNYYKEDKRYFHNEWFKNKINGITEVRKYDQEEVDFAKNFIINNTTLIFKELLK
tara:strand:+ start:68 stop:460 length:393 start_codon:yes stop_codon:yes gene_type:complete